MTKHEADIIGGLNMTDQISNEAYKQIMIATQDENEVGEVLDKIRDEMQKEKENIHFDLNEQKAKWVNSGIYDGLTWAQEIIDKYREPQESEDKE